MVAAFISMKAVSMGKFELLRKQPSVNFQNLKI
jgi:hypothetical protein